MKTAVLILDIQKDFVGEQARMPVAKDQIKPMLDSINQVVDQMHPLGVPILYIGNEFEESQWVLNWFRKHAAMKGQPGAMLDERLRVENDLYFSKKAGNALGNPKLVEYLAEHKIEHLVIAGLYTEGCVLATARGALQKGYGVTILTDAVASASDRRREWALRKLLKLGAAHVHSHELLAR